MVDEQKGAMTFRCVFWQEPNTDLLRRKKEADPFLIGFSLGVNLKPMITIERPVRWSAGPSGPTL